MKRLIGSAISLMLCGSTMTIASELPLSLDKGSNTSIEYRLSEIDASINQALNTLNIPGIAVGAVVDGKIVLSKGYGVRAVSNPLPVTEDTLFAIASCSKTFTTCALGQLVDEGTIAWDDPVIIYLPEFRLKDSYATQHLTIRDLVTHRSGLPRHDLVWYNSKLSKSELLNRLQHLESSDNLREQFQYNNLMYVVAGLLIERVTGQTWEACIQERIFDPLGMKYSNFSVSLSQQTENFAVPHREENGLVKPIPFRNMWNALPAGGINSSISDMLKWVQINLNEGEIEGRQLIQKETLKEMHSLQMPMHPPFSEKNPHLYGYGLGWILGYHKGHFSISHGGSIDGFLSWFVLLPKEKIGVVVLINSHHSKSFALRAAYALCDILMGTPDNRWLTELEAKDPQKNAPIHQEESENNNADTTPSRPLENYVGAFEHPGYGTMEISLNQDGLMATLNDISLPLKHKSNDRFTGSQNPIDDCQFDCSFVCNSLDEISEFHIKLESQLPPIPFKR